MLKGESAVPSLEQWRDKATTAACKCAGAHTEEIFNPAFNTSYRKHQESSPLKKHGDETQLCSLPCAGWSSLPAIVNAIIAVSQMAGPANVSHPSRDLRVPSSTFWLRSNLSVSIRQHSLRHLIPPFARGHGLPWREHRQPRCTKIHQKRWQSKAFRLLWDKCLRWITRLLTGATGTRPGKQYRYYPASFSFFFVLTARPCDTEKWETAKEQKAEKQVWVYSCMSMYTCTHNTITCTTRTRNSNYRGFSGITHPKPHFSVWVVKTSLNNSKPRRHLAQ